MSSRCTTPRHSTAPQPTLDNPPSNVQYPYVTWVGQDRRQGGDPIRVAICDDQELVRCALASMLEDWPTVDVVGDAADGAEAIRLVRELDPDVLLLDLAMPNVTGLEVIKSIKAEHLPTRVLVLSASEGGRHVREALEAGAIGYVTKSTCPSELHATILSAMRGETRLSPELATELARHIRHRDADGQRLSGRERDVLALLSKGFTVQQTGAHLYVAPRTVQTFVARAADKMGTRGITATVAEALRRKLIE